jgi:hypothetical protein
MYPGYLPLSPLADVTSSKIPLGPRSQLQLNTPLPAMHVCIYVCTGPQGLAYKVLRGAVKLPVRRQVRRSRCTYSSLLGLLHPPVSLGQGGLCDTVLALVLLSLCTALIVYIRSSFPSFDFRETIKSAPASISHCPLLPFSLLLLSLDPVHCWLGLFYYCRPSSQSLIGPIVIIRTCLGPLATQSGW